LKKAVIVGANLAFDPSVLAVAYHEYKTENGFSSELAPRYKTRERGSGQKRTTTEIQKLTNDEIKKMKDMSKDKLR